MQINRMDHLVMTVRNIEETCRFYTNVLGMRGVAFGNGRRALEFGTQKINLHEAGKEFLPKARVPQPGAVDICLLVENPILEVMRELESQGVPIEEGPVIRTGAMGELTSIYIRDPDGNLVELSRYNG